MSASDLKLANEIVALVIGMTDLLDHQSSSLLHATHLLRYGDEEDKAKVIRFLDLHGGWLNSLSHQLNDLQSKMIATDLQRSLDKLL